MVKNCPKHQLQREKGTWWNYVYKFLRDIFVHFKILFIIITCLEYLIKSGSFNLSSDIIMSGNLKWQRVAIQGYPT